MIGPPSCSSSVPRLYAKSEGVPQIAIPKGTKFEAMAEQALPIGEDAPGAFRLIRGRGAIRLKWANSGDDAYNRNQRTTESQRTPRNTQNQRHFSVLSSLCLCASVVRFLVATVELLALPRTP